MTKFKYLVKMTPLNTYFFGGEKTFTTSKGETNYFARSNQWPQQTTVLGMLRYLIGKSVVPEFDPGIIGNHSFIIGDSDNTFGMIDKLSPVFLVNSKGHYLLESGTDHQKDKKTGKIERFELKQELIDLTDRFSVYDTKYAGVGKIPNLTFDYKEYLVPALRNTNVSDADLINPSDLFIEQFQVGNKKNYKGGTDDEAFFKQVFYRLAKGYSFAVILETNAELPFNEVIDTMGADQSLFKVEATDLKDQDSLFDLIEKENESVTGASRIVLLSDAFVEFSVIEKCRFAISGTNDFRNIVTHTVDNGDNKKTGNFHQITHDIQNIKHLASKHALKFNLLRRGSVLFANDAIALLSHLNNKDLNNRDFQKIGYNYFQLIK